MYLFPASEFEPQTAGGPEAAICPDFSTAAAQPALVGRALTKRVFDMTMAAGLLLFLAPLMVLTAMLVRLTSKGPSLFKQRRTGLNGRIFYIYKFRTMTVMEDGQLTAAQR